MCVFVCVHMCVCMRARVPSSTLQDEKYFENFENSATYSSLVTQIALRSVNFILLNSWVVFFFNLDVQMLHSEVSYVVRPITS